MAFIRAVIIAAREVTLSSNFLSGLLETDAIALHCDERHRPAAWRLGTLALNSN